ncbi:MAG: hypothetical protein IJX63_09390 [Lachnospiraceae bacterium]|nr:hypothetical protein [Lachnospiraceae bacterium]
MISNLKSNQKLNKILQVLFPIILFLYPLRHICYGVGWTDTAYNYANFMYMDNMDDMWLFSTYLGTALGNFFAKLPLGGTMLGLNLYTGLFVSVLAVAGYFFFVKSVQLSSVLTFGAEFVAINLCWCPTALLYNYLSFTLLGGGAMFLYFSLMKCKHEKLCFVLAGICLGINVFVRLPNLTNMALIVAVWAMGIIRKEKPVKVLQQTGWCILGYIIGLGGFFGLISLKYGAGNYIDGVMRLLSMPSEAADYSPIEMVLQQVRNYKQNLIWIGWLLLFVVLGTIVYQILPRSWKWLKNIGYVGAVFCGFYLLWALKMFNMEYTTYMSMLQWAFMLLTATLAAGVVVIFKKGFTEQEKLLCGISIIIMLITPLGSNNHLYLSINNLFFILPFTLWLLCRFFKWLPKAWKVRKWEISTYPLKAMLVCVGGMILLQTTLFALNFVFLESDGTNGAEKFDTTVENNDILKGMYMEGERAESISEISSYVQRMGLKGKEVILYGKIPAMSYYLEMPFAISAWPDLASYNLAVMLEDLQRVEAKAFAEGGELPVILMEKSKGIYARSGAAGLEALGYGEAEQAVFAADQKLLLLADFINKYGYKATFENDKFVLFQAGLEE